MKLVIALLTLLIFSNFSFANSSLTVTNKQVHQTLKKNKQDINNCYQSYLAEGFNAYGKVIMKWNVHPDGRATHVKTVKTIDRFVSNCLAKKIRTWSFPKSNNKRIAEVQFPFVFSAKRTLISK